MDPILKYDKSFKTQNINRLVYTIYSTDKKNQKSYKKKVFTTPQVSACL